MTSLLATNTAKTFIWHGAIQIFYFLIKFLVTLLEVWSQSPDIIEIFHGTQIEAGVNIKELSLLRLAGCASCY